MVPAIVLCVFLMLMTSTNGSVLPTPKTCRYQGHVIPEGGRYQVTDCETCFCHQGELACMIADCFISQCVDPVDVPGVCCPKCPNGPNCYHGKKIIPAGVDVPMGGGMSCRCPKNMFAKKEAVCTISALTGPPRVSTNH